MPIATNSPACPDEERLRDALFASMRDSVVLADDELRAHYEQTRIRYVTRQLVLRRKPLASEAQARAEDRRLGAAGRLAADGAESIGPAPTDRLPEALSFTSPGQRAAVMRDGVWSLVELEEIRAAETLPFEAVRAQVEQSLRLLRAQSEFHAEIDRLRQEAVIER